MKELRQDTRMTLLSRIPVMLLSFISITILTRWLGPEGNGVYTFIFANINLLLLLFGLQSETAVLHYLAKKDADKDEVVSVSLFAVSAGFLVCGIFLLLLFLLVPAFKNLVVPPGNSYTYFIGFIIISFLFRKSQNTFLAIQRATLQFKSYNFYQLYSQIIPVLLYAYGFLVLAQSTIAIEVIPVFNFILASQALISFIGGWMVFSGHHYRLNLKFRNIMPEFYTFSTKSTLDAIAKFINRRVDVYFVQAFKGVGSLGQYGLAAQINNFAQEAILPFTQVMNPYLVKEDHAMRVQIVARLTRIIFSITLIFSILIVISSPFVIPLFFGQAFSPSVRATQILSLAVVISTLRMIFASYFQSINRLRFNIQSNWLGVVMTIVLDILLIPSYGIEGAAVASILAYTTSFLFLYFHFSGQTHTPWKDIFLIRKKDITWLLKKGKEE